MLETSCTGDSEWCHLTSLRVTQPDPSLRFILEENADPWGLELVDLELGSQVASGTVRNSVSQEAEVIERRTE